MQHNDTMKWLPGAPQLCGHFCFASLQVNIRDFVNTAPGIHLVCPIHRNLLFSYSSAHTATIMPGSLLIYCSELQQIALVCRDGTITGFTGYRKLPQYQYH